MKLHQPASDRLEFWENGQSRINMPMWLTLPIFIGLPATGILLTGSWLFLPLALGGCLLALIMRRKKLDPMVVAFDRTRGTVTLSHFINDHPFDERVIPLGDIKKVIVEAKSPARYYRGRHYIPLFAKLLLRPALLVNETIVPLTFESFERGARPTEIANRIRQFLGHPQTDLTRDSIETQARYGESLIAARHFARSALNLDYFEANEFIERLRSESDGVPLLNGC